MTEPNAMQVAAEAGRSLARAGIAYVIGGSIASTIHGEPRGTMDADIAVFVTPGSVDRLVEALDAGFFVQADARSDLLAGRSTALYHRGTFMKVDLFGCTDAGYARAGRERAVRIDVGDGGERVLVSSAEDIVLQKLLWYRKSDEALSQQWRDVLGVLKAQAGHLDAEYMDAWATQLDVSDLLDRARVESGLG